MERRYNFRIYPNKVQKEQIQNNFGCVRFIYNYYLAKKKEAYENGQGTLSYNEMCRDMTQLKKTQGYEWLKTADYNSLQRAIRQLDLAYQAFFRNVKKKGVAPGYPSFKTKKNARQSYTSPASAPKQYVSRKTGEIRRQESSVALYDNRIKLPKLGLVRCRVSKKVTGRILSATVIRSASGKYYVSVVFTEQEKRQILKTGKAVGIHMGAKHLITTSDGMELMNPEYFRQSAKKIARLQKELSRKAKGSKNFERSRKKLSKKYEQIHHQKMDMMQKLTTKLIREYDVICIRNEAVAEMKKRRRFSKQLADAGWGELIRQLSYKAEWYGKELIKIEPSYPNVRICSGCGYEYPLISRKRTMQEWHCPKCHIRHKRNVNAAVNILQEGMRLKEAM